MVVRRSNITFYLKTIAAAVLLSTFFSVIFGVGPVQTLGSAIATLGLAYRYGPDLDGSEAADEDESVNEGDELDRVDQHQSAESVTDPDGDGANSQSAADEPAAPSTSSKLRRSNQDIIEETEEILNDRVTLYDDGTISIEADDLNLYSKMMLYVIAKRVAYEDDLRETHKVTVKEIRQRYFYNKIEVLLFLYVAGNRIKPKHHVTRIDYAELDSITITANLKKLPDSVEWAVNEKQSSESRLWATVSYAKSSLNEAESQYEAAQEKGGSQYQSPGTKYNYVVRNVIMACTDVAYYPVEIDENHISWDKFTDYVEAGLDYLINDHPTKFPDCVGQMKRYASRLEQNTDEELWI